MTHDEIIRMIREGRVGQYLGDAEEVWPDDGPERELIRLAYWQLVAMSEGVYLG